MEKIERNSNIELLRIILMFMVITLHFNNTEMGGGFNYVQPKTLDFYFLYFFESLSVCAVNCFMIISGYFLAYNKKVKLGKIIDLLLIVIFYRVLDYLVSLIIQKEVFSIRAFAISFMPLNYFAIFYIVSYIFSPYVVQLIDSISIKKFKILTVLLICIFVIYSSVIDFGMDIIPRLPMNNMSSISTSGSINGYTSLQFFVDLVIGMFLRRMSISCRTFPLLCVYILNSIIMTVLVHRLPSVYAYSSIFTVINAVILFLFFNNFSFDSKITNYVSKSVFSIFCIHTLSNALMLWKKWFITPFNMNGCGVLCMVVSVISMFLACLVLDLIVRNTFGYIKNWICKKCPVLLILED